MDIKRELCDTVGLEKISLDARFFERCEGLTWYCRQELPSLAGIGGPLSCYSDPTSGRSTIIYIASLFFIAL